MISEYIKTWPLRKNSKAVHMLTFLAGNAAKSATLRNRQRLERGQYKTSLSKLASEIGTTIPTVRGVLKRLRLSGDIAHRSSKQSTTITMLKYSEIFGDEKKSSTVVEHTKPVQIAHELIDHLELRPEFRGKDGVLKISLSIHKGGCRTPIVEFEESKDRVLRMGIEAETLERWRLHG